MPCSLPRGHRCVVSLLLAVAAAQLSSLLRYVRLAGGADGGLPAAEGVPELAAGGARRAAGAPTDTERGPAVHAPPLPPPDPVLPVLPWGEQAASPPRVSRELWVVVAPPRAEPSGGSARRQRPRVAALTLVPRAECEGEPLWRGASGEMVSQGGRWVFKDAAGRVVCESTPHGGLPPLEILPNGGSWAACGPDAGDISVGPDPPAPPPPSTRGLAVPGAPLLRHAVGVHGAAQRGAALAAAALRALEAERRAAEADRDAAFSSVRQWQGEPPALAPAWEHRAAWRREMPGAVPRPPQAPHGHHRWEHLPSAVPPPREAAARGALVSVPEPPLIAPYGDPSRAEAEGMRVACARAQEQWEGARAKELGRLAELSKAEPPLRPPSLNAAYARLAALRQQGSPARVSPPRTCQASSAAGRPAGRAALRSPARPPA
eukprot:TRINITY_DN7050_c0_g1_i1.p2 TRINITY_DN7050_c0_g1~~TRINITY_DN7050_c0_g1_i1.p2  ORF type:complete len:433 (+),score=95.76 TRINITY_DN7050_c0_g1_i1:70-1368(+)